MPLDSTFLRGQNMVDHEMEQEQHRRHLELQEFIREQMKEKSRRRGWNRDRRAPVLGVIVTAKSVTIQMNTAPRYIARSRRLPTMAVVTVDDSLVDEGSLTSEHVEISAKSDRRRRHRHKSSKTRHHGQHSRSRYRHNHHRRRDICDTDSHYDDGDTDRYRKLRSSLDGKKPYYEPRQRRLPSPSVVRDRYRGKGRRRQSRSHTNSYDDSKSRYRLRRSDNDVHDRHRNHETPTYNTAPDNARPRSVPPMKRVSVCSLPTRVDRILLS